MTVLFATNRAMVAGRMEFSSDFAPSGVLYWGLAAVTGGPAPLSQIMHVSDSGPGPDWLAALHAADADTLLITLHGFDYDFDEAILRAAGVADFYADGTPAVKPTIVAFCWPSLGELGLIHYKLDCQRASDSAPSFRLFLKQLAPLLRDWRAHHPGGRIALLAHSMGNHFLHAGLEGCFHAGEGDLGLADYAGLFDAAILAAGDENDRAFEAPDGRPNGLRMLLTMADRTVVLFNPHDAALIISRDAHLIDRIGHIGARDKMGLRGYPITFIDCGAVDGFLEDPEGHQYYRCVPEVRDLICAELKGSRAWQGPKAVFRPPDNAWELDRPQALRMDTLARADGAGARDEVQA